MRPLFVGLTLLCCLASATARDSEPVIVGEYTWTLTARGNWLLSVGSVKAGAYFPGEGNYYPWAAGVWLPPCAPPIPLPAESRPKKIDYPPRPERPGADEQPEELDMPKPERKEWAAPDGTLYAAPDVPGLADVPNFGVGTPKIARDGEHFVLTGRPSRKDEVVKAITGGGTVPDDRAYLSLTVIGTPADCKRALDEIKAAPELADLRGHTLVQWYEPTDEMIQCGFSKLGTPVVYLEKPDGEVLLRRAEWGPDTPGLLRCADPNYDPSKDPDGKPKPKIEPVAPTPEPAPDGDNTILIVSLVGGGLLMLVMFGFAALLGLSVFLRRGT